ncbi:hypothetical protein HGA91_02415 [candidate division WWE3 bacterium]|nr:hypothetical protein [candidate division WWE3 bacterium]
MSKKKTVIIILVSVYLLIGLGIYLQLASARPLACPESLLTSPGYSGPNLTDCKRPGLLMFSDIPKFMLVVFAWPILFIIQLFS